MGHAGLGDASRLDYVRLAVAKLRPHGRGSIPWLLVDEAGQAVPHQALGAIWRAKRAVVVGDPFQVEPVVTMDGNADAKLAERRGAPDHHRATLASAQTLADAANPFGASVRQRGGRAVWVWLPAQGPPPLRGADVRHFEPSGL